MDGTGGEWGAPMTEIEEMEIEEEVKRRIDFLLDMLSAYRRGRSKEKREIVIMALLSVRSLDAEFGRGFVEMYLD